MPDQETQPQGGYSELAAFGEELRREREIRGISLKEISDATKISKRFLDALERNDHKTLPAPVFTRGFVREYARYVGLNSEDMVNRYNYASLHDDRIDKPPQIEKYPQTPVRDISPKPPVKRGIPSPFVRVDRNAVILVVLIAALAAVALWAVRFKRADLAQESEPPPTVTTPAKDVLPVVPPAAPKPDDTKLRLTVQVADDAWLKIEADGEPLVNTTLRAGATETYEANEQFRFSTGNSEGLTLRLNDTDIPAFGTDVVKNRVFDRKLLETLRAGEQQEQP